MISFQTYQKIQEHKYICRSASFGLTVSAIRSRRPIAALASLVDLAGQRSRSRGRQVHQN